MSTLNEILTDLAKIESQIEESGGEISPEVENEMTALMERQLDKVDGCAVVMDRMELSSKYWKDIAAQASATAKALESQVERFEEFLIHTMRTKGLTELKGEKKIFKLTPTKGSVEIINREMAEKMFGVVETTVKVPLDSVRTAINNGNLEIGRIRPGWRLNVKPNKGAI